LFAPKGVADKYRKLEEELDDNEKQANENGVEMVWNPSWVTGTNI
jgi:hypothetical protein